MVDFVVSSCSALVHMTRNNQEVQVPQGPKQEWNHYYSAEVLALLLSDTSMNERLVRFELITVINR